MRDFFVFASLSVFVFFAFFSPLLVLCLTWWPRAGHTRWGRSWCFFVRVGHGATHDANNTVTGMMRQGIISRGGRRRTRGDNLLDKDVALDSVRPRRK